MEAITPIQPEPIIQPPVVNPSQPQNNLFKVLFFVFFVLFLVALVVLFYFLNKTNQILQQNQIVQDINSIPIITSTPTEIPTPIVTKQPTTKPTTVPTKLATKVTVIPTKATISSIPKDWKTYTNSTYKYSIQYPSLWTSKVISNKVCLSSGKLKNICEVNISVTLLSEYFDNPNKLTFDQLATFSIKEDNSPDSYKTLNINGLKGYAIQSSYPAYKIIFNKSNFVYEITFENITNPNDLEKQILNTFKFN